MRMTALLLATLGVSLTGSVWAGVDPEAEARLSEEALARYAAPGDAARFEALNARLEAPAESLGRPAAGIRMTLRSWPNGKPRTTLFAKEAWVAEDMMSMRGRDVLVEQWHEDGSQEATVTAEEAVMDRNSMLAVAKGTVTCTRGQDRLEGKGAWMDLDSQYLKVLREGAIYTARLGDVRLTERGMF